VCDIQDVRSRYSLGYPTQGIAGLGALLEKVVELPRTSLDDEERLIS
jgi:hypothetical protein